MVPYRKPAVFCFFPVIQMYVLCSAKDTLYSAGMLLVIVLLLQLFEEKESFGSWKKVCIAVGGFVLYGGYAAQWFLYNAPDDTGDVSGFRPEKRKKALAAGIGALALYFLVTGGLGRVLHAQAEENQEMLTVPIQQLARVYACSPSVMTQEEQETLHEFLPEESAEALYSQAVR